MENPVRLNGSNDKRKQEIRDNIIELFEIKVAKKRQDAAYEEKKNRLTNIIENYMDTNGHGSLNLSYKREIPDPSNKLMKKVIEQGLRVIKVVRNKIVFNPDKLEEKLGKEFCRDFIYRKYIINDWDGMVKLLKSHGIQAKDFIGFIDVEKSVDEAKIEQMEAVGDLSRKELQGTYEVKQLSSYLQVDTIKQ